MLQADSLTKRFGRDTAVDNFSCSFSQPTIVGLLGANGAGKTTIMRMLAGYLAPTEGRVLIGGYDVLSMQRMAKQLLGYLPETPPLYPDMRVREYIDYIALLKRIHRSQRWQQVSKAMEMCRIEEVADYKICRLSRGFRQRIGLAQALLGDPSVLIVDEPTSNLDPLHIQETRNLLRKLGKDKIIVISTHVLSEVEQICDHVIIICKGHTVLNASLCGLLCSNVLLLEVQAPDYLLLDQLSSLPEIRSLNFMARTIRLEVNLGCDARPAIWQICKKNDWPILKMDCVAKSLEDIYIQCTVNA